MSKRGLWLAVSVLTGCDLAGPGLPDRTALALVAISTGWGQSCSLAEDGSAYCWGGNSWGQLGGGAALPLSAAFVPIPVAGSLTFASISAGQLHSCALTPEGSSYCWGRNAEGQLGTGTADGPLYCATISCATDPVRAATELEFRSIAVGWRHSCGVTLSGDLYCWGDGSVGQLGTGEPGGAVATPAAVQTDGGPFVEVSTSRDHTCALSAEHSVYCWGSNHNGQTGRAESEVCLLGDVTVDCISTPQEIIGLAFSRVAVGGDHSCGLTLDGLAYCWGSHDSGRLGLPLEAATELCPVGGGRFCATPLRVEGGRVFADISAGGGHTCAIDQLGDAYCWGTNHTGQLGICSAAGFRSVPSIACGGLAFSDLAAGGTHTCALTTGGLGYCWGDNDTGALGSLSFTALGPVRIAPVILSDP